MKMKNIIALAVLALAVMPVSAQEFQMNRSKNGNASLSAYEQKRLEDLPNIQAYQASDGTVLKSADSEGFGVEVFAGAAYMLPDKYFTPEMGLSFRYDAKKVSYRVSASALTREYNSESIEPGKRYYSYAADAAFHVNILNKGWHVNVVSLYSNIGYIYGRHRYAVEAENGGKTLRHNGSGLTYGGGLEYRCQIFATGNSLTVRAGYKTLPNTYLNNTKVQGAAYVQVGFNFGCARNRVRAK